MAFGTLKEQYMPVKAVSSQTSSAFKYWLDALLSGSPPKQKEKKVSNCFHIFIAFLFVF